MLKANVGVSRKLSEDHRSAGFSLNLEGEINATLDDPHAVIERIRELYDLAEEALDQQVEQYRSDSAIAGRDRDLAGPGRVGHHADGSANGHTRPPSGRRDDKPADVESASDRQLQFLRTLAGRRKLSGPGLEAFIEESLGRRCSLDELSKKDAGAVIDALNAEEAGNSQSRR